MLHVKQYSEETVSQNIYKIIIVKWEELLLENYSQLENVYKCDEYKLSLQIWQTHKKEHMFITQK